MLSLDRPVSAAGLSFYADHRDDAAFHLLPGSPAILSQDGRPSLRLQVFRGGANGGLLWMDVVLRHPPGRVEEARAELTRRVGREVTLVPVLFHAGSVRLSILNTAKSEAPASTGTPSAPAIPAKTFLIEKVLASTTPSLLGDQRAIFSVRLDPEGAVLLKESLRDGVLPATIVYDLYFRGLQPASGLRAHLQNKLSYEYLRAHGAVDSLWFRADLSREVEALQKQGMLSIEDIDYTGRPAPDPAARREQILRELREWMELIMFRPAPSPALPASQPAAAPALRETWSQGGFARAAFVLRSLNQQEEQELTYERVVTSVAEARIAPQGLLLLPAGAEPRDLIQDIDLERPPISRTIRGFVPAGADWTGVTSFTLDVKSGTEIRSGVFDPQHTEQTFSLPAGDIQYRVHPQFTDEPGMIGVVPQPSDTFQPCPSDYLSLDPAHISGRRAIRIVALDLGAADISAFSGTVETGGKQKAFQLTPAQPEAAVAVWNGGALRLKGNFRPGSGIIPWEQTFPATESILLIRAPGTFRSVTMQLNDPLGRYSAVFLEIGNSGGQVVKSFRLDSAHPSATWTSVASGSNFTFRYRVRRLLNNAETQDDGWKQGDGSLLVAGDTNIRAETIEILWLGPPLLGGLLKLTSTKVPAGINPEVEVMFDETATSLRALVPFALDAERRYAVEGQVFTDSDTIDIPAREETGEVLLLSPA